MRPGKKFVKKTRKKEGGRKKSKNKAGLHAKRTKRIVCKSPGVMIEFCVERLIKRVKTGKREHIGTIVRLVR